MKRQENVTVPRAEREFRTRAEGIFRTYPELLCFCLDNAPDPGQGERHPFDIHVGLATAVSAEFEREMCDAVNQVIAEAVYEDPEAVEMLLGRTFARMLH